MEDKTYLGRGWAFPPQFIKGEGVAMVSEEEDIRQSLHILFSTSPGQRIFRFDYGCQINKWTFHEMNLSTRTLIEDSIRQAILYHEPRIAVERLEIRTTDERAGVLFIHLDYRVQKTNTRSNMVYPYYFAEGTIVR